MSSRRPRPRRRGRRSFAVALLAGALAAAALGHPALGGGAAIDRAAAPATATAQRFERVTLGRGELEPVTRSRAPSAAAARAKNAKRPRLRLSYYVGVDFQEIEPGGAQLFEIRCPERGEQPLAGGTFAPVPGVATVSSSRVNPDPEFPTRPRAWYQAVVNIMSTPLRWKPFVTCGTAKGVIR